MTMSLHHVRKLGTAARLVLLCNKPQMTINNTEFAWWTYILVGLGQFLAKRPVSGGDQAKRLQPRHVAMSWARGLKDE